MTDLDKQLSNLEDSLTRIEQEMSRKESRMNRINCLLLSALTLVILLTKLLET